MELRQVGTAYSARLVALWHQTFKHAYKDVHSGGNLNAYCAANYTLEAAEAALADPATVCKVVSETGNDLGFYLLKHHECPIALQGGSAELKQIYLLGHAYRSGIGGFLLDDAMACVRSRGAAWIWLSVSDLNTRARAFYDNQDFKPIGKGPVFEVGTDRLTSTVLARGV